jgi:hypothetical protein
MDAEQLIIHFHELTSKRVNLERRNKELFCEKIKNKSEATSCIGNLIDQLTSERCRGPEEVFTELLSKNSCCMCRQIWKNKCEIKAYSKQIGITKNRMHALAKKLSQKNRPTMQ